MRQTLSIFLSFFLLTNVHAQQFKWVKGGGTTEDLTSAYSSESVQYMCTDPHGNVYALSVVGNNPIYADTFYSPRRIWSKQQFTRYELQL